MTADPTMGCDAPATGADIAELRAGIYRALWIQGAGIAAVMIGIGLFG